MTEPTELLPCPFCGAAAHFEMDEGRWEWVECESCGMQGNRSASLMDDCKPKLAEEWNRRTPPAVAPWRSAVLDLIDDCPGLTLEQDRWLSRRVKELDFASTPQPTQAQAGAVPLTDIRKAALDLYTPPFRHEYGYIRDANHQMAADDAGSEGTGLIASRIRGWGRIQYMDKPEQRAAALQDEVAEIVAEALNAYWAANGIKGGQHGSNT